MHLPVFWSSIHEKRDSHPKVLTRTGAMTAPSPPRSSSPLAARGSKDDVVFWRPPHGEECMGTFAEANHSDAVGLVKRQSGGTREAHSLVDDELHRLGAPLH